MRVSFFACLQFGFAAVLAVLLLGVLYPAGNRLIEDMQQRRKNAYREEIARASGAIRHNLLVGDYGEIKVVFQNLLAGENLQRVSIDMDGTDERLCLDRTGDCADDPPTASFVSNHPLYFDEETRRRKIGRAHV